MTEEQENILRLVCSGNRQNIKLAAVLNSALVDPVSDKQIKQALRKKRTNEDQTINTLNKWIEFKIYKDAKIQF